MAKWWRWWPCRISIISFIILLTFKIISGNCRILAFPSSLFFEGERLVNHTTATISVIDRDTCEFRCYLEHSCVSINFNVQPKEPETENCELNNSTSQEHEKDLIKAANYVYHGTNVRTFYKELTRNMFHITDKIDWRKKTNLKTNKVTKQFCWWVVLSSSLFRMPVVIYLARTMQPVNQVLPVNDIAAYALPDLLATTVITVGNYYFCFPFKDTIKLVWSD